MSDAPRFADDCFGWQAQTLDWIAWKQKGRSKEAVRE